MDTFDALCSVLCESAEEGDEELQASIPLSVAHMCFACDEGAAECPDGNGLKYCLAVLTHAFAFMRERTSGDIAERQVRSAYVKVVATMIEKSGMLADASLRFNPHPGSFVAALHDAASNVEDVYPALLADLAPIGGVDAVADTVDVLCALLVARSDSMSVFLSNSFGSVVTALRRASTTEHREKLLTLVAKTIPLMNSTESLNRLEAKASVSDIEQQCSAGSLLANALKPCVISTSTAVRCRVAEIIGLLLSSAGHAGTESELCLGVFTASSGFTDYLFEALRHPLRQLLPEARRDIALVTTTALRSSLATPILHGLTDVALKYPEEIAAKWSYALPVVCKAALTDYDNDTVRAVFVLLAKSCSTLPVLTTQIASDIAQMFLQSGASLNTSTHSSPVAIESSKATFEVGIFMLAELAATGRFPASFFVELMECAECIATLAPRAVGGVSFVRNVLNSFLEKEVTGASSEAMLSVKSVAVGVWSQIAISIFTETTSSLSTVVNCIRLLGTALDCRLFEGERQQELGDLASNFLREIPISIVFNRLENFRPEVQAMNLRSGVVNSSDIWNSAEQKEANESTGTVHADGRHGLYEDAGKAVRSYFARIVCALPGLSQALGITSAPIFRTLECAMPADVDTLLDHLASSSSPDELDASIVLILASLIHTGTFPGDHSLIFQALLERVDSDVLLSEAFRKCVLPVIRMVFRYCGSRQSLVREILLPKVLCQIALSSDALDIADADAEFLFYALSFHDTELRMCAWSNLAESRIRGDPSWRVVDTRLAELLSSNTSAAKCFVSSCLEGTRSIRLLALDLISMRPKPVATTLLKVGLSSVLICVIERRQTLQNSCNSTASSLSAVESCENCLAELVAVATMAVQYGDREDLHRMLMMLVDVFVSRRAIGAANDVSFLDTSILRYLSASMNAQAGGTQTFQAGTRDQILDYLHRTTAVFCMQRILREAVDKISNAVDPSTITTAGWRDGHEFEVCAVACTLDYVIRLHLGKEHGGEHDTSHSQEFWKFIVQSQVEWTVLLFESRRDIGHHASDCRRAACMQLLTTMVVQSVACPTERMQNLIRGILCPQLLASTVAAAANPSGLFQAAAQAFLVVLNRHQDFLFGPRDLRLSNLASHRALVQLLGLKFAVSPRALEQVEYQYIGLSSFRLLSNENVLSRKHVEYVDAFSGFMLIGDHDAQVFKAARDLFQAAGTRTDVFPENSAELTRAFECALEDACTTIPVKDIRLWDANNLLVGCRAILPAPLAVNSVESVAAASLK
jgi:hypothetical protein